MKTIHSAGAGLLLTMVACSNQSPLACLAGLTTCPAQGGDGGSYACVDTQNDAKNCGGCGQVCPDNQLCALSSCGVHDDGGSSGCMIGFTTCPGAGGTQVCVDTRTDAQNCGGCGLDCGDGGACALSNCVPAGCGAACGCGALESRCALDDGGTICADLASDPSNCGVCGASCDAGEVCGGAVCLGGCPQGTTACTSDAGVTTCSYLPRDPLNCGQCGLECFGGQGSCLLGQCFEARPPALPAPRWALAAAADLDGGVYAIGGADEYGRSSPTVLRYIGSDGGWVAIPSLSSPRSTLAATTGQDGRIYVVGGEEGLVSSGVAEVYDPAANQWNALPSLPTPRAWLSAATGADGRIYALGGQLIALSSLPDGGIAGTYTASNAVEIYDPATGQWSSGPNLPTPRWALAAARGPDGAIYVMGGQTDLVTPTDVVERLAPDGGWQTVMPLSSKRAGLGAAVGPDGHIYAMSGYIYGGIMVGTVDVYDVTTGSWTQTGNVPTPRYGFGATTAAGPNGYIFTMGGGITGPLSAVLSTVEVLVMVGGFEQWQ